MLTFDHHHYHVSQPSEPQSWTSDAYTGNSFGHQILTDQVSRALVLQAYPPLLHREDLDIQPFYS